MADTQKRRLWLSLSPWAILGSLVVLAPIAFFMAASSINRDKENMTRLLVEKGAALIRAFEAGARTGMMGMGWSGMQVQRLLVETAQQPDIVYLVVTDKRGRVVAHSNPDQIGKIHHTVKNVVLIEEPAQEKWQRVQMKDGTSAFEVYKLFTPIGGISGGSLVRSRGIRIPRRESWGKGVDRSSGIKSPTLKDWCSFYWKLPQGQHQPVHYIFVGLEMAPLESARAEARRNTLVMSAGVLLVGFAGMISLFLAQGYKLARRSLAKVRAYSDQVVGNLPMGLVASDENGRIAAFNDTAEAILGKPGKEVIGETVSSVLPSELWQLTDQLKKTGTVVEEDIECRTGVDTAVPLRTSAAVVRDEGGSFLGYVFIFRDLTYVRRLQQEVERSRRLAALGRLAAGVAHEIRNPLSSIKGFATYFKERLENNPQDQDTAKIMIQEVERLDRVIGQLLEFARPSHLRTKPVRLADLIQHSLKLIEGDARARGVEVKAKISSDLPEIELDADRMSQVLLNLYLNSIQAMDEGGTIEVKASRDDIKKYTKITISDNGKGIDPKDKERIFDPYFTTKSDGTGLGLAIVHKIMEAHRGDIEVESRPGLGTTITLILRDVEEAKQDG
ncbi:MAG: PAS domain-containing protein [Deltaproteobacteria bacterium]|nr:PAS domain-containing protein [Deltaproteobacteria bacterium]